MKEFLRQVAEHYVGLSTLDVTCFVFPNRRSLSFFRKYLGESARRAMFAPAMVTINDFFYRVSASVPTDRILLLLRLYACYERLYPQHESVDEFIFWGDVILSDFDDIDKYLVDARMLLQNVADLRAIEDSYSYLSDRQRAAIERFVSHFRDRRGGVKERFLRIWNILYPLYEQFRADLLSDQLSYEGMVYRAFAERLKGGESVVDILHRHFPKQERFVFVGLNALNECERLVLGKMRDASLAEFAWDYASRLISHPLNQSSFFLRDHIRDFPQAFPLEDAPGALPRIHVISCPSAIGQAKLLPTLLNSLPAGDPVKTAVVLPDEQLLIPVLGTLPERYPDVNVTMGYPLASGALYALVSALASLQNRSRVKDGCPYFYYRGVYTVFSNSIFRRLLSDEEAAQVETVRREAKYYIPATDLSAGEVLRLFFRPEVRSIEEIQDWLQEIISRVGHTLSGDPDLYLEVDFARRYWTALGQLRHYYRDHAAFRQMQGTTWFRLLDSLVRGESVPFEGEPLKGLQIMGPLETRALDFDHVIILSANEGVFPRRSVSSSFIPPQLRTGFSLPTYAYQDAVWAYYFYRLIQRAQDVWMIYDSRTEGVRTGEESRYIKQLQYHFRIPIERSIVASALKRPPLDGDIPKTEEDIALLYSKPLSASSLKNYLDCPARFYYQFIKGLREDEDVAESLDAGGFGNVYHATMQAIYWGPAALAEDFDLDARALAAQTQKPLEEVSGTYLRSVLADPERLRRRIHSLIRAEMHTIEVTGRNLVVSDVILQYVQKTLERDIELLQTSSRTAFRILGLEKEEHWRMGPFRFKGIIDRMDSLVPGEVRIVDYKTGKVEKKDIEIDDDNAAAVVEDLFGPSNAHRPKIALQLFLYDVFARECEGYREEAIRNAIYAPAAFFTEPVKSVPLSREFSRLVRQRLNRTLEEMADPAVPFRRTQETETCQTCPFKTICGR